MICTLNVFLETILIRIRKNIYDKQPWFQNSLVLKPILILYSFLDISSRWHLEWFRNCARPNTAIIVLEKLKQIAQNWELKRGKHSPK
jgi:hypothetical protein